jgi:hypothetical protein
MLDELQRATLVAIDRLTRDTYGEAEGEDVLAELKSMGREPAPYVLTNLACTASTGST